MRLRNVKGSREAIASSEFTINDPEQYKGKWNTVFGNDNPIYIEVGMGKGRFITDLAIANPDINYIGIENMQTLTDQAVISGCIWEVILEMRWKYKCYFYFHVIHTLLCASFQQTYAP